MSTFYDTKRASHQQQRAVSQGAGITLVVGAGVYSASFECAEHIARVLGSRELKDAGDGIFESIPVYKIPTEEMFSALQKLALKYSIALVELVCERNGSRFVLVWKIAPTLSLQTPPPASQNLDDY